MSSRPPAWRRRRARGVAAGLVGLAGLTLAACGGGAGATGRVACAHVEASLALYHHSLHAPPATAARERAVALSELRHAMHYAALIGSAGGTWQALAATLEETDRVPESAVAPALAAQCAALTAGR